MLGGTFDPIHIGHLVTGMNVRHELGLDLVLFVVANEPWQKADRDISPAADRLAMVAAALRGRDGLVASSLEIDRGGTSYTADTLSTLRGLHPDAELYLVVGADQAANLHTWERLDEVRELATLAIVGRPGSDRDDPPPGFRVERVDVPSIEMSSSEARARFCDGRPLDWLVPDEVVRLAKERGLYRRLP